MLYLLIYDYITKLKKTTQFLVDWTKQDIEGKKNHKNCLGTFLEEATFYMLKFIIHSSFSIGHYDLISDSKMH